MKLRGYAFRYLVESWNKPAVKSGAVKTNVPEVMVSGDNYGYADEIFICSIINTADGNKSVLPVSQYASGSADERTQLELVRDAINHYLEKHAG